MFIWEYLIKKLGKAWATIVTGLAILLLVLGAFNLVENYFTADIKAQSELDKATGTATQESGKDAVNTVGQTMTNEADIDKLGRDNANDISKAEGANTAVPDGVRNAGLSSLCKRASYRASHPECVQ